MSAYRSGGINKCVFEEKGLMCFPITLLYDDSMRFMLTVPKSKKKNKLDECGLCKQPKNYKPGETPEQALVV